MDTLLKNAQDPSAGLTIGELAERSGVSTGTLRMWESRYGFPLAHRLPSGHRRYAPAQVAQVLDVVRRRELGVRLDAAVRQVVDGEASDSQSLYAELTRRHPEQPRRRLRKDTLLGLSWAIEDEVAASGAQGHLFGGFQEARHFEAARPRWTELARVARSTHVFADFSASPAGGTGAVSFRMVHLAPDAPMRREWSVVHDSAELPVVLTAWELPGQSRTPDRERLFESVWSLDPAAVRTATRCCAGIAAAAGTPTPSSLDRALAQPVAPVPDVHAVTRLAHRALAYVDAGTGRAHGPASGPQ